MGLRRKSLTALPFENSHGQCLFVGREGEHVSFGSAPPRPQWSAVSPCAGARGAGQVPMPRSPTGSCLVSEGWATTQPRTCLPPVMRWDCPWSPERPDLTLLTLPSQTPLTLLSLPASAVPACLPSRTFPGHTNVLPLSTQRQLTGLPSFLSMVPSSLFP